MILVILSSSDSSSDNSSDSSSDNSSDRKMSNDLNKLKSLVSRLQQKKNSNSDGIQRSGSFDMTSISRDIYDDVNGDIISLASLSMKKKKKKVILSLSSSS